MSCVTGFQKCAASLVLLFFSCSLSVSACDWLIGWQCLMYGGRGGWKSIWQPGQWVEVVRPCCGTALSKIQSRGKHLLIIVLCVSSFSLVGFMFYCSILRFATFLLFYDLNVYKISLHFTLSAYISKLAFKANASTSLLFQLFPNLVC